MTNPRHASKSKPRRMAATVPEHAGPLVKLVFSEMARQRQTYNDVGAQSGVQRPTLKGTVN
jgi:hypothetical protein